MGLVYRIHKNTHDFSFLKEKSENEQKINDAKNQRIRDSINTLNYIDSLKDYNRKSTDSLVLYSKRYTDSLKRFSQSNADSLKNFTSNIFQLLGKYNLKYDEAIF